MTSHYIVSRRPLNRDRSSEFVILDEPRRQRRAQPSRALDANRLRSVVSVTLFLIQPLSQRARGRFILPVWPVAVIVVDLTAQGSIGVLVKSGGIL